MSPKTRDMFIQGWCSYLQDMMDSKSEPVFKGRELYDNERALLNHDQQHRLAKLHNVTRATDK
jgi:hypothetical protein